MSIVQPLFDPFAQLFNDCRFPFFSSVKVSNYCSFLRVTQTKLFGDRDDIVDFIHIQITSGTIIGL